MNWKIGKGYMPGIYNVYDDKGNPVAIDCTKDRAMLIMAVPNLLAACELVEPAITSLLDELGQRKATDWGLVNDCLCEVAKAIRKAKGEGK